MSATTEHAAPGFVAPSLVELALTFNRITLLSFGGGLSAWSQRIVVEEKKWLTNDEFLSAYTLARVMPGANQANFAVYLGNHFRGIAGSATALLGLFALPFCIVVALGAVYFAYDAAPALQRVLHGVVIGAVGLSFSMALKSGEPLFLKPVDLLFIALAFAAAAFKVPLAAIFAVLGPPAIWLAVRRIEREKKP